MNPLIKILLILYLVALPGFGQSEEVIVAIDRQALLPIRIAENASERLVSLAKEIRSLLSEMSGAEIKLERRLNGPGLRFLVETPPDMLLFERENYSIRSTGQTVTLTGNTVAAVEHAAWDLMHRLGYRQFFPGKTWEIVPQINAIRLDINCDESPDYHFRRIWYGYGTWDYNDQPYRDWCRRNRMGGSAVINSGHAYGQIVRARQAEFDQHPEFYALLDGKRNVRPEAKLCIGNPQLRATVVDYARAHFDSNPLEDCISVDPSDGGGWCECELCQRIGSPSDRALLLANEVADAAKPRLVGMYAYNYHSSPPSIDVRPNVCIVAATAFIKDGRTIDEIVSGWSEKGATIGIREYYSVNTWDRDLPGAARGSNLEYLATSIPKFHRQGARFMNSESSDNWGCNGPGYYFASHALWDLRASEQRDIIVDDFLNLSFGAASGTMRDYYELIGGENKNAKLVYGDLLARMYRLLQSARTEVADGSAEQARVDDLILYTRYVDLFDRYRTASGTARQKAFEDVIRHAYRIRTTMMVHSKGLYRDLPARDKSVSVPVDCGWRVPEDRNPWKSSTPFESTEIDAILRDGEMNYQPIEMDFELRQFSDDLVFATNVVPSPMHSKAERIGSSNRGRGKRSWFTRFSAPSEIVLQITGGLIAHYRDRGNVKVSVYKLDGSSQTG
jgi:hypothetical protein